jgi:hypothetical protein
MNIYDVHEVYRAALDDGDTFGIAVVHFIILWDFEKLTRLFHPGGKRHLVIDILTFILHLAPIDFSALTSKLFLIEFYLLFEGLPLILISYKIDLFDWWYHKTEDNKIDINKPTLIHKL